MYIFIYFLESWLDSQTYPDPALYTKVTAQNEKIYWYDINYSLNNNRAK